MDKPPAQPNQSLIDGLACLGAVAGSTQPLGVRELARQLNLETTRANRLLKTLAHLGLTHQNAQKKYHTGPGIHVLAAQSLYGSGLLRRAAVPLEHLRKTGLIVALGVLWRDQVCYLYHAAPGMSSVEAVGRAGLYPASRSSIGMALLAHLQASELRGLYLKNDMPGHPQGIASLLDDLRLVQQQGYARVSQPKGVESLGVVIPEIANQPYAALALSGSIRPAQISSLVRQLQEAALAVHQPATGKE